MSVKKNSVRWLQNIRWRIYVDFDHFMYFSVEGVVILYSPYEIGPYVSGFISVTIPYEELGIRLVGVYGMDVTPADGKYFITW